MLFSRLTHRKFQFAALAFILIAGACLFLTAGYFGLKEGAERLHRSLQQRSWEHYNKGEAYLREGNLELALAEFEEALRLYPRNEEALRKISELKPLLQNIEVTPPQQLTESILDSSFQEAQNLYREGKWEEAAQALENLRLLAPDYRKTAVVDLMISALYRAGLTKVQEDELEIAIQYFDKALALNPEDPNLKEDREKAALYLEALTFWGADWERALKALETLAQKYPDYKDSRVKLKEARFEYARALAQKGDWCRAEAQLRLIPEPDSRIKSELYKAYTLCYVRTPTPSLVPSPTGTLIPATPIAASGMCSGQIAWADYDSVKFEFVLYSMDLDKGQVLKIAEKAANPALSPDGKSVLFRSLQGDMIGLARTLYPGGEKIRVTTYAEDTFPSWAPDGKQIAFASRREGDRKWRIYIGWATGLEAVRELAYGTRPTWSPDGKSIVFQGCAPSATQCGLVSIGVDGSNQRLLTPFPGDTAPAFSPDGTKLAFMSAERDGNWEIYVLEIKTGRISRLTSSPEVDGLPVWSPDGRCLAFLSHRDGKWGLYLMRADGSNVRLLTTLSSSLGDWMDHNLSWGP
ncbi:MAG: tetratricopeptide repeat protein [Anaerolineae bacterium]|nr:tetratricopeptide repeat protein [Anaerolineae bacterium]